MCSNEAARELDRGNGSPNDALPGSGAVQLGRGMEWDMIRTAVSLWLAALCAVAATIPTNEVTIADTRGRPQANRPFTISRVFAEGEIPPTQCDIKPRWPDGSGQLMSFLANLPAKKTVAVSFVDQPGGNNSGALARSAMLAASWDGQIELTNETTLLANARRILTDWDGSDRDFRVTYLVTLRVGAPAAELAYAKAGYAHAATSRWRKSFWNGKAPGSDDSNETDPGYPHIWKAAATYFINLSDGSVSGSDAWRLLTANVRRQDRYSWNPQYAVAPRSPK